MGIFFIISPQPVKLSNNKTAQSRALSTLLELNKDDGKPLDIESNSSLNKKSRSTQKSMDIDKHEPLVSKQVEDANGEMKAKDSKTLTFNVELSDDNEVVGNKRMDVHEHAIFVNGTELYESKEVETLLDGKSEGQSILKHTRRIGDQQFIVLEKRNKGQILSTETITPMTPNEVSAFKEKWRIMWHPKMLGDKILDLVIEEGHAKGEPETNNEVEAAKRAMERAAREALSQLKSRKEQERLEKKKRRF